MKRNAKRERILCHFGFSSRMVVTVLSHAGGGPRTCRPMSPSLAQVGAVASHMGARLPNPHDSDAAHEVVPVLSLPPAAIFEAMVDPNSDVLDNMQGSYTSNFMNFLGFVQTVWARNSHPSFHIFYTFHV